MDTPLALVVDDDEDVRVVTQMALERISGWKVLSADRGRTAIDLVREHRPSVVLMDLMMPEMDGVEASRVLLDDPATADVPIVLLTARSTVGGEEPPWTGVAVAGVIAKPFNPRTLGEEVAALLGWDHA